MRHNTIVIAYFGFMSCWGFADGGKPNAKKELSLVPVEITLRMDRTDVKAGEGVTIEEFIPLRERRAIISISHVVTQIGSYDDRLQRFVNLEIKDYKFVIIPINSDKDSVSLPGGIESSHPMRLELENNEKKGIRFTVHPEKPGIYMVGTIWRGENRKDRIASNPVILIVRPSTK